MSSFIKKFQQHIFHKSLLPKGSKIIVGVSGGPDSVALVRVLEELREKHCWEIFLIHVNYHLRGKDSDEDEEFVKNLATDLGLELEVVSYKKKNQKGNLEEKLRDFRYALFERKRKEKGYDLVVTAHHKDDQVETFLMNLLRGASLNGLGAIRETRGNLTRPFLVFEKKEIFDFLKNIGQDFRNDKSNEDNTFFRNRVRNELLPLMLDYSPGIKDGLLNLAGDIRQVNDFVEEETKKHLEKNVKIESGKFLLDLKFFLSFSDFFQGVIFLLMMEKIRGKREGITRKHFQEFLKLAKSGKSKIPRLTLWEISIKKKDGELVFSR